MGNDVVLVGPHPDSGYRHYLVACCRKQKISSTLLSDFAEGIYHFA